MELPLILCLFGIAPAYRYLAGTSHAGDLRHGYWLQLPASSDSLCCGALLAWSEIYRSKATQKTIALAILLVGVGIYFGCEVSLFSGVLKKTCVALILGWVVFAAANRIKGPIGVCLEATWLSWIGKCSYGLYVIHAFAPSIWNWLMFASPIPGYRIAFRLGIPDWVYGNWGVERLAWTTITTILVLASYRFLETPLNCLKRYFPYSKASIPKVAN